MTDIEVRQACSPGEARRLDTSALRAQFHVGGLFREAAIRLVYTHVDRFVIGAAVPTDAALTLEAPKPIGSPGFLDRRELGVFNIGGAGEVRIGEERHRLETCEALYVGMGAGEVSFVSRDPARPARFYLLSTPAHAAHPTRKITPDQARRIDLGAPETANVRQLVQMIHPQVCASCQLVMGFTRLAPGAVWNTMPCHTHDRRSEVYLYFDLAPAARVFHLMGEPDETRHLVMANEEAAISPGWSIHAGCGTQAYSFVWAMAGDNQEFADMDHVAMEDLR
ncbi:MAG: 5-dehydro-4-deoxy-D-glucuronate isomerase [Methylobacteriaceae bacterium]|nr:5-dehydro-4-deoxy-D-glucuronate isomerase [Methylobacteriaceae bacterium]